MFKMIVHVTESFDNEAQALKRYNDIRAALRLLEVLHINCQITKKFTGYSPEHPDGHKVIA